MKAWNRFQLAGGIELGGVYFDAPSRLNPSFFTTASMSDAPPGSGPSEQSPKGLISLGFQSALTMQLAYKMRDGFSITGEIAPGIYIFGAEKGSKTAWAVRGSLGAMVSF